MQGWDESVPLLVQIAEDFVDSAMMHPGESLTEAMRHAHLAIVRRERDAERKRRERLRADSGLIVYVVCPACGEQFPSTCAAAHRPRAVCSSRCRLRKHRGVVLVSAAA
jgi:hypothetical protein